MNPRKQIELKEVISDSKKPPIKDFSVNPENKTTVALSKESLFIIHGKKQIV